MEFKIQKAKQTDLDTLYEIEKKCFTIEAFTREQIESLFYASNSVCLVATANNTVAAFIIGLIQERRTGKIGYIITIDVLPEYRRKNISDRLLEEVEHVFRDHGIQDCYLEVRADNTAALNLYTKHGYRKMGRLRDFYSRGIDGVRMKKCLANT